MKKFEYKIENYKTHGMVNIILTKKDEEKMNLLGEDLSLQSYNLLKSILIN